ncbi:hypothetical protein FQN50_007397 [Emmonsiellopsis sp. PD_5]|nr:hypothetical protein FQN50_007397 [Emmonsiellopsis sp. PD_5]
MEGDSGGVLCYTFNCLLPRSLHGVQAGVSTFMTINPQGCGTSVVFVRGGLLEAVKGHPLNTLYLSVADIKYESSLAMVSTCGLCRQPPFEGWDILGTSVCEQQAGRDIPCNVGPSPGPKAPINWPCKFCHCIISLDRWFHRPCFEILRASYGKGGRISLDLIADTTEIIDSLLPTYAPAAVKRKADIASTREGLFSPLTKDILASIFTQELPAKFPPEIVDLILEFSGPCWYLIVLGEARRLIEYKRQCDLNTWSSIPLPVISAAVSKRIYVSRVTFQGTRYIGRISSEPLPTHFSSPAKENQEYYDPPDDFDRLLLIADGVAARDIKLLRKGEDISREEAEGLWYNVVNISELTGTTILRVEGIKTTHNRSASFGKFFDPGRTQTWHLINPSDSGSDTDTSSPTPNFITGLYHSTRDPTDPYVSYLGVTCAHNTIPPLNAIDEPEADIGLKSGFPGCALYNLPYSNMWPVAVLDDAQLTRARARNITRVTLCQEEEEEEEEGPIMANPERPRSLPRVWGMLLTYSDGREEALGQFRWDLDTSVSFRGGPECVLVERREYRSDVQGQRSRPPAPLVEFVVGVLSGERARRLGFVGEMEGKLGELGEGEAEGYSWRRSWRTIRDRSEGGREHILWWIVKEEDVIEFV